LGLPNEIHNDMLPKCSSGKLLGFSINKAQAVEYGVTITQQAKKFL